MKTAVAPLDQATPSAAVPTTSAARFEHFTAREAELFLRRRFSIFIARGLDVTTALLRATHPEER